jgi:hypothetical protein
MTIQDPLLSVLTILLVPLFVISLIIHSLTYFHYDPREFSLVLWWGLQLSSAFALMLALLIQGLDGEMNPPPPLPQVWSFDKVVVLCLGVFLFYGVFNFLFIGIVLLHNEGPAIVNDRYTMGSHGFFTPVSKEVFMKAMVYEARMNSGHWMAFFLMALSALRSQAEQNANAASQQVLYKGSR